MAANVVNLRQFRKHKASREKERQANQNRMSFGRTKAEKNLTTARNEKARHAFDQGHLERDDARIFAHVAEAGHLYGESHKEPTVHHDTDFNRPIESPQAQTDDPEAINYLA